MGGTETSECPIHAKLSVNRGKEREGERERGRGNRGKEEYEKVIAFGRCLCLSFFVCERGSYNTKERRGEEGGREKGREKM